MALRRSTSSRYHALRPVEWTEIPAEEGRSRHALSWAFRSIFWSIGAILVAGPPILWAVHAGGTDMNYAAQVAAGAAFGGLSILLGFMARPGSEVRGHVVAAFASLASLIVGLVGLGLTIEGAQGSVESDVGKWLMLVAFPVLGLTIVYYVFPYLSALGPRGR